MLQLLAAGQRGLRRRRAWQDIDPDNEDAGEDDDEQDDDDDGYGYGDEVMLEGTNEIELGGEGEEGTADVAMDDAAAGSSLVADQMQVEDPNDDALL
jgi:hypothetical protein